jgi:TfoX/Sxy family transcriptional regulator of competence genes
MAYDQKLAGRIRERLCELPNIEEKEMMGGVVFMYNDKMCLGVIGDEMMCRIDPEQQDQAVEQHGCRTMQLGKRPMKGYIVVEEIAMRSTEDFEYWIQLALVFNPLARSSKKKNKAAKK